MPISRAVPDLPGEIDLIARAARFEPQAVRAITAEHNRRLYRVARSILRDDTEAEDALQSAWLRAFSSLSEFRHESSLSTWLTRIVMNEALGRVRGRRPTLPLDDAGAALAGGQIVPFPGGLATLDPERSLAQRQVQAVLERAIDELPAQYRTVLVARVLEEMSVEETAILLDLKPETVKTRLHRARRLLRQAIERRIGPVMMNAFPFDGWRCERMTGAVLKKLAALARTAGNPLAS
jgi:RNA polymerase sigma-70 factor, ECF subfamily